MKTTSSQRRYSAAQSVKSAINTAVYQSITEGSHQIDPPKLSPELWDYVSIQAPENRAESERLEFLGDAVMDACIAIELHKTIPDGNPHKYTEILSVVHSNFTFSHVVHKMGLRLTADTKSIGDIFETMIGAYYTEKGFQALHEWVKRSFEPILQAAAVAFDEYQSQKARYSLDRTTSIPGPSSPSLQRGSSSPERGKGKRRFSEPVVHTQGATSQEDAPTPRLFRQNTQGSFSTIDDGSSRVAQVSHSSHGGDHRTASSIYRNSEPRDSSSDSSDSDDEESDELPAFWEEKRDLYGQVYYVDHATRTTSWDRPRRQPTGRRRHTIHDAEAAWTARLVAPLPPVPPVIEENLTPHDQGPNDNNRPSTHSVELEHPPVIIELLGDGYLLEDSNVAHLASTSSAMPEFCEEIQAEDGRTYYVDHPASTILLR